MVVSLICHRYLLHRLSNLHLSLNLAQFCFASISEIKKSWFQILRHLVNSSFNKALQMTIASTYATGAMLLS